MTQPLGIYEKALTMQGTWLERLSLAAERGFDFVEISVDESKRLKRLDWSKRQIKDVQGAVLESGVTIYSIILSALRTYPLGSASKEARNKSLNILKKAIDVAATVGIKAVQIPGYFCFYEASTPDSKNYFLEGLYQASVWASQAGIMLGLENMDGEDVLDLETALCLIQKINSPWLKLYPDIGNLAANGLKVSQELRVAKGQMIGIHLKDTRLKEYRRVPFGEGIVPFKKAFKTLKELNYTGPFLLEMWNDDAPNAMKMASEAKTWMQTRMQEAGLT